jgi:pyruvate,water dikinase
MILKGIPASEGEFEGTIKIFSKEKEFNKKDILVATSTSPEMSAEMLNAGAVLTEYGGLLSHASIFCREIKKPCVVGIKDLLNTVSDGMKAKINGKEGIVEISSNEE